MNWFGLSLNFTEGGYLLFLFDSNQREIGGVLIRDKQEVLAFESRKKEDGACIRATIGYGRSSAKKEARTKKKRSKD